jgi:hypothetical protein
VCVAKRIIASALFSANLAAGAALSLAFTASSDLVIAFSPYFAML